MQNPLKWTSLAITGVGVEVLRPELATLTERFPRFKFTLRRKRSHVYTKRLNWNPALVVERSSPARYKTPHWKVEDWATVELLISAERMSSKDPKAGRAVYAVVPAHLLLDATQRISFATVNYNLDMAREEIERKTTQTSFAIGKRSNSTCCQHVQYGSTQSLSEAFDLKHPPLFSYRHWFSASTHSSNTTGFLDSASHRFIAAKCSTDEGRNEMPEECRDIYMNDVGLLSMETWQADIAQQTLKDMQPNRVERIKEVNESYLRRLCQRKQAVAIGNATGHLIRLPYDLHRKQEESNRMRYAMHLPFILTSPDPNGHAQ